MTIEEPRPAIYTTEEAVAAAKGVDGVIDAYVLSERIGAVTLTVIVGKGTSADLVRFRLVSTFEGRTMAEIVWLFEVVEGEVPK